PGSGRRRRRLMHGGARGLDGSIHQHRIKPLKQMIRPGGNHETRILSGLEKGWWKSFLELAGQEKQRRGMITQDRHGANGNEKLRFHPSLSQGLASRSPTP